MSSAQLFVPEIRRRLEDWLLFPFASRRCCCWFTGSKSNPNNLQICLGSCSRVFLPPAIGCPCHTHGHATVKQQVQELITKSKAPREGGG